MLHDFPKHFQRPPFTHGSSMQHGCNMTRGLRMLGRAFAWAPSTLRMPPVGSPPMRWLRRVGQRGTPGGATHWPALNEKHNRSDQLTNDKRRHCVSAPACRLARPAGTLSVADLCRPVSTTKAAFISWPQQGRRRLPMKQR
jgi:hypothetical protein